MKFASIRLLLYEWVTSCQRWLFYIRIYFIVYTLRQRRNLVFPFLFACLTCTLLLHIHFYYLCFVLFIVPNIRMLLLIIKPHRMKTSKIHRMSMNSFRLFCVCVRAVYLSLTSSFHIVCMLWTEHNINIYIVNMTNKIHFIFLIFQPGACGLRC